MTVLLWVFTVIIFLTYSFYFVKIMLGKPEQFEYELLKSLATWMVSKGSQTRPQLWLLLFISAILETFYFVLVFANIEQPVLVIITSFFVGLEIVHLTTVGIAFNNFFSGKLILKDMFNWKMERVSGLLFFTHSLLVMISLAFY